MTRTMPGAPRALAVGQRSSTGTSPVRIAVRKPDVHLLQPVRIGRTDVDRDARLAVDQHFQMC